MVLGVENLDTELVYIAWEFFIGGIFGSCTLRLVPRGVTTHEDDLAYVRIVIARSLAYCVESEHTVNIRRCSKKSSQYFSILEYGIDLYIFFQSNYFIKKLEQMEQTLYINNLAVPFVPFVPFMEPNSQAI